MIGKRTKVSNFGIIWEKRQIRLAAILGQARAGSLAALAKGSPLNNPDEITFYAADALDLHRPRGYGPAAFRLELEGKYLVEKPSRRPGAIVG